MKAQDDEKIAKFSIIFIPIACWKDTLDISGYVKYSNNFTYFYVFYMESFDYVRGYIRFPVKYSKLEITPWCISDTVNVFPCSASFVSTLFTEVLYFWKSLHFDLVKFIDFVALWLTLWNVFWEFLPLSWLTKIFSCFILSLLTLQFIGGYFYVRLYVGVLSSEWVFCIPSKKQLVMLPLLRVEFLHVHAQAHTRVHTGLRAPEVVVLTQLFHGHYSHQRIYYWEYVLPGTVFT